MKKLTVAIILLASAPLYGLKIYVDNYGKTALKMDTWYDQCSGSQTNEIPLGHNEIIAKKDGSKQCWLNKIKLYTSGNQVVGFFSKKGTKQGDSKNILETAVYNGDLSDGVLNIVIGDNQTAYLIKNDVIYVKGQEDKANPYTISK